MGITRKVADSIIMEGAVITNTDKIIESLVGEVASIRGDHSATHEAEVTV